MHCGTLSPFLHIQYSLSHSSPYSGRTYGVFMLLFVSALQLLWGPEDHIYVDIFAAVSGFSHADCLWIGIVCRGKWGWGGTGHSSMWWITHPGRVISHEELMSRSCQNIASMLTQYVASHVVGFTEYNHASCHSWTFVLLILKAYHGWMDSIIYYGFFFNFLSIKIPTT